MGQRLPSPQVKAKMTKMTNLDEIWQTQEARRTRRPGRFEEKSIHSCRLIAVERPGERKAGGDHGEELKLGQLLREVGQVGFQELGVVEADEGWHQQVELE